MPRGGPSGSPLLRPNWLRSRLMSSWPEAHPRLWPPSKRPGPSPLSSLLLPIRLRAGSSPVLRGRAAMSRGCPTSPRSSSASVWNCSSRPFRGSVGSPSFGIQVAPAVGVRLQFLEARGPADFDRAFSDMTRARAGALTSLGGTMFFNERRRLVDLAAKNRLPAVYPQREFVDAGGLMAYGPNTADLFRRAATYVDKILKGAKPADLPVEQPTKFELVINLKAAKALGLTI